MKTLRELYKDISKDPKRYLYYSSEEESVKLDDAWTSATKANEFIKSYFKAGGKDILNIDGVGYMGNEHVRNVHTVSAFILGIVISEGINRPLKEDDLFLWYMTCLFHDIGYDIEENNSLASCATTLDNFITKFHIKNNLFDKYRKKTLCRNYYRYIKNKWSKIDHGIAGGLLLYDKLIENYNKVKEENGYENEFIHNNLLYTPLLFEKYEKAAICIIRHNMWIAKKQDHDIVKLYKRYHLEELIEGSNNKIKYNDEMNLFLLCLADTIEPTKHNEISILDEIYFEPIDMGISLVMPFDICDGLCSSIADAQIWLDISVKIKECACMTKIDIFFKE